ncbi:MAG: phage terminase small subunit P27 family [Dehalococcoidia bacterium]
MGERGPLPVPYARRRNLRRRTGKVVTVAKPAMPRSLSPEAKAEWRRVVPELEEIGVLATIDRAVLMRYCTAWSDWCEVQALLTKSGPLVRGRQGTFVRNPLLMVRSDVEATLSDLGKQLGLTPGARLRADITHEKPEPEEDARESAALLEYRRRLYAQPDPREMLRS